MRKIAGIACAAMLLSACSTGPQRPSAGPGSGVGAAYVPMVEPSPASGPQTGATYEALVAKCQREASGLPFIKTEDHDAALFVVGVGVGAAIGWNIGHTYWSDRGFAIPLVAAATPSVLGLMGLFSQWVYSPQAAVWRKKQETQVANCMARSGYKNVDPTVLVTWLPVPASSAATRPTGRDTFTAEKLAKSRSCAATPMATLVAKGPGFEDYRVACTNGPEMAIHCEFGQCRAGSEYAAR
ncbi:hypothetical protein QTI33_20030 [Variovorax sp. J22P271]|uniref:hypothetical protein n=1 Tax=Variovorax davisae TaxID=3053515 RepID=UPI0025775B33|nr:hypothetical protein [Variovorax sp. J22P271]MDM0034435.1 hypothetical protein [Variovorax sp. J22P271]